MSVLWYKSYTNIDNEKGEVLVYDHAFAERTTLILYENGKAYLKSDYDNVPGHPLYKEKAKYVTRLSKEEVQNIKKMKGDSEEITGELHDYIYELIQKRA